MEALLLGILQGLTEYLPVSSSGHLAMASHFFGASGEENLMFTIMVHVATVLSTLVILRKQVLWLFLGAFKRDSEVLGYWLLIIVSMIPVGVVGVFFKDYVEDVFGSGLLIVGLMLLLTALLLALSYWLRPKKEREISPWRAFVIGLAQAAAVMPGLSRSGTTIATGLLLGCKKARLAEFSFLMVIPPILGEALLDGVKMMRHGTAAVMGGISPTALLVGFLSAFVFGALACKWMIALVKRGKLIWFALYCLLAGVALIALN